MQHRVRAAVIPGLALAVSELSAPARQPDASAASKHLPRRARQLTGPGARKKLPGPGTGSVAAVRLTCVITRWRGAAGGCGWPAAGRAGYWLAGLLASGRAGQAVLAVWGSAEGGSGWLPRGGPGG